MKVGIVIVLTLLSAVGISAQANSQQIKVVVIEATSTAAVSTSYTPNTFKCDNKGCTGAPSQEVAVPITEVDVRATVNAENVLLTCDERRRKECLVLTAGTYDGELKGSSLWIISQEPLTHKQIKRRFKIMGSW